MKRPSTLFFTIVLAAGCLQGFGQDDTVRLKRQYNPITVTDRAPQAVYAELFGKGLFFTVNYDRRFSKRVDGLGFSVGMGYLKVDDIGIFSLPVGLNYLLGKNGKYFEFGAGASYLSAKISDINNATEHGSTVIGTMTLGYRSQPIKGGFMFRAGFNPLIFRDQFLPYYPYVSLGYSF
jgi:hypothetical protein